MTRSPSILRAVVVDDEIAVAALHRRFVDAHQRFTTVGVAHSGSAAVAAVIELEPDVVLLDLHLPGLSGLEVLRQVRIRAGKGPEVIAVTAARDIDSVTRARTDGVRHYLVKPFTSADLSDRLDAVISDLEALEMVPPAKGLEQSDIDALLRSRPPNRSAPPKGLSTETLTIVEKMMLQEPGSSASEIGELAGVSRVSSRRYLEYLVQIGRAERSLEYRATGRPISRYGPPV